MLAHQTWNPFDLWLTPDVSGILTVLGWAHDLLLAVMLAAVVLPMLWLLYRLRPHVRLGEGYEAKQRRLAHGHYIGPYDLDTPARKLLARAQRAIDVVQRSEVNRIGWLDHIHNQIALPTQEWEIAKVLCGLAQLRARHPELAGRASGGNPAQATLDEAIRTVIERVSALEVYAEHVRQADVAYHLDQSRDEHAALEIEDLTDQARVAVRTLQLDLTQVDDAGLPAPAKDQDGTVRP